MSLPISLKGICSRSSGRGRAVGVVIVIGCLSWWVERQDTLSPSTFPGSPVASSSWGVCLDLELRAA